MRKQTALVLIAALVLMLIPAIPISAATGKVLVYTGDNAFNNGYTKFGTATGKVVETLAVLPGDLSAYDCILLPANRNPFSADTMAALVSYVNAGGRIIAQADQGGPGSTFLLAIANFNNLATALGSNLSLEAASIDSDFFHVTTNIGTSPFTTGVSSIAYAWTSKVAVSGNAQTLVRTQGGPTDNTPFIGIERIGDGWFVLVGDLNVLSDFSGTGYTTQDNGVLARNITNLAANQPPVANANGPYVVNEGSPVAFNASGSTDPDGDPLQFRWDFDNNGTWDTDWSSSPTATRTWPDDWTGTVIVEVSDNNFTSNATALVTVNNVAPVVNAGADRSVYSGESIALSTNFTDAGVQDTHTASIDWGDSTTQPGTVTGSSGSGNVAGSHTYLVPGTYTVTVTVTDDNGGVGNDGLIVEVKFVPVTIDIIPGSPANTINVNQKGVLRVAIVTSQNFNAATVNATTVRFGPANAAPVRYDTEDVDHDGNLDLLLHLNAEEAGINAGDTEASLTGQTISGVYFKGTDTVRTVPKQK
ncbi:MAG: hypothetical protein HY665_08550 [Chloroflexi bacterium]|nr:hypothetical protein [Chloroflexota bacterium]